MNQTNKELASVQLDIHNDIINECKLGNRKSQYQLYQLYAKAMYNICYRMMNNKEEAEDMLQESFTDAFQRLESFRFESTFGAWLKQIVINKCINTLKKKKTALEFMDDMSQFDSVDDEPEIFDKQLTVNKIKNAMNMLPSGGKLIFSLYMLEGYDHTEIAQILDISESTSKSQYMRARLKLKEILGNIE